ncbi:hypothetical protein IC216_14375 [Clostridioides sp. ES-S-0145-01]|uniref:hypothetical protein n=1 Tax=Clostridioides sp. ES-S-0145-01 TaxID=2770784 RepID=UPI001D0F5E2F|nr:hypothetical protein [Clostridioides sp. ES-S-0145-01]
MTHNRSPIFCICTEDIVTENIKNILNKKAISRNIAIVLPNELEVLEIKLVKSSLI